MSSKVLSVRTSASSKGRGTGTDMTMGGTGRSRLETSNDVVWGYARIRDCNNNKNGTFRRFFSTDCVFDASESDYVVSGWRQ